MKFLRPLFKVIAAPGIIGPHHMHEEELLLKGVKPIGIFSEPVFSGELAMYNDRINDDKAQILRLDNAVEAKRLAKCTIESIPDDYGTTKIGHFYAQPQFEAEMKQLADWHEAAWQHRPRDEWPDLPDDPGVYLGYTESDLNLWDEGGYYAKSQLYGKILEVTANLRRYCRAKDMLWDAEDSNSPSPEH